MKREVLKSIIYKGVKVEIVRGDLTEEDTEAIVNAANSYLKHGGGVAGAIVRKGGRIIQEESDSIGYVPVGKAALTGAGSLKAKYVIHAVGPRWGEGDEDIKLESAVKSALEIVKKNSIKSVSLPAISTGIFGFPKERGARIILKSIKEFIESNGDSVRNIRCVNIDTQTSKIFNNIIDEIFKEVE